MPRWLKHLLAISAVLAVAACSGSSGCSSCGMTPLPNGFNKNARIENAAAVRLTKSGLDFIERNIGPLAAKMMADQGNPNGDVVTFPINESKTSGTGYEATVCPGGPDPASMKCIAETKLSGIQVDLSTAKPHDIFAVGTIPLRLKDLPIKGKAVILPFNINAVLSGGGDNDCNKNNMSFADIPFSVRISMMVEKNAAHASRQGYTKMVIDKITIDDKAIEKALHFCGGGVDDSLAGFLKGFLVSSMMKGLNDTLISTINEQLCQKADPKAGLSCPAGSTPDKDDICRYSDGACVSMMLGMDGHMDLGSALASVSPGTTGGLDILLAVGGAGPRKDDPSASWGDLNPVQEGATLGMFGGAEPNPISHCVTPVKLELPKGILQPDELQANKLDGWQGPGPHVGFAIAERYLNYALASSFNSGVFCMGITTEQVDMLTSATLSLMAKSLKKLGMHGRPAPVAITVRPKQPPTITIGSGKDMKDDPLLMLNFDQLVLDFYIWSADRFIRAFTLQLDMAIPLGLDVSSAGITPVLDKIYVENASITNAPLMTESPDKLAAGLSGFISGLAGQISGSLKPIDVSSSLESMGLKLHLEQNGIRKLEKGSDRYLGIFAALEVAKTTKSLQSDTQIELVNRVVDPEGFTLTTRNDSNTPRLLIRVSSDQDFGSQRVEYSYKLDDGLWHAWTTDNEIVIDDPFLMVQGRHTVRVKSRLVGRPDTEDPTPAELSVLMDVTAPRLQLLVQDSGQVQLDVSDPESNNRGLQMRYALDDGNWSDWKPVSAASTIPLVGSDATEITVQVKDEEGNVATKRQSLIRGRPDGTAGGSSGCGCSVPGADSSRGLGAGSSAWALGMLFAAALLARSRRNGTKKPNSSPRSRGSRLWTMLASAAVLLVAGSWSGCSCSDDTDNGSLGNNGDDTDAGPDNDELVVVEQGLIGEYTSAAVGSDGTIWIAGYNEGDPSNGYNFGDLVVGKWNGNSVDWVTVDGLPSEPADAESYDVNSWRQGRTEPGPDVGMWTSIVVDQAGHPMVAYQDVSNHGLKFASFDGSNWNIHTVFQKDNVHAGRYAKMLLVDGKPVIAFQTITLGDGANPVAAVHLARATKALPSAEGDWSFEVVAQDDKTPCRKSLCVKGQMCVIDTGACIAPTDDCSSKCDTGQSCFNGKCVKVLDKEKLDTYPDAIGDYISMALEPDGNLGIVYYDRPHGNLWQARMQDGKWATKLLDGQTEANPPKDTGDVGIGASLFIDKEGNWHIAYVDGFKESVKYLFLAKGTTPAQPETADDGAGTDNGNFDDGHHIVGDDVDITVSPSGDIRLSYQDATAGTLRWTVGHPKASGTEHDWTRTVIQQTEFAGFFSQQIEVQSATKIVNWWRKTENKIMSGDVRVVSP